MSEEPKPGAETPASYRPDEAFAGLFRAFTGQPDSIGGELTSALVAATAKQPLLVSTASDIVLFPGDGRPAQVESFRRSTRGFIELTAVSHVPLALAYVARLRELDPSATAWRQRLDDLVLHIERTRAANRESMWREHVALPAFDGIEGKIAAMVESTLAFSTTYANAARRDSGRLDWEVLRESYLERRPHPRSASMNEVMFATFCLAYLDIAYRIGNWLRSAGIEWPVAMVLVSGQSGRPTAGVTWSSNNICRLIWKISDEALPAERVFVAPHAPGFSVDMAGEPTRLSELERDYRRIWCHTRSSVEVARRMFPEAVPFGFSPALADDMPRIAGPDDGAACVARLRRIMEDPQQLLSNCVADYVVDQLRANGNRPQDVAIPGFTGFDF